MKEEQDLLKQIKTHLGGRLVSVLLGVVVLGISTRLLGPERFGIYGTALAYLQLFGILMDFGLTITALDLLAVTPSSDRPRLVGALFSLRAVISAVVMAAALVLVRWIGYSPETQSAITLASLVFILYTFQQLFTSIFQFAKTTAPVVWAELSGRVVMLVGLGLVASSGGGVLSVIAVGIAGNAAMAIILAVWSRRVFAWAPLIDRVLWRKALEVSWPVGLTIAFNLIYFKADTLILALYAPAETVGLYVAPYKILEVLVAFPPLFLGLVLPQWSKAALGEDWKEFSQWLQWTISHFLIILVPMVVGVWVLAGPIMEFVAGSSFRSSGAILQILIIATAFIFLSNIFGYCIIALKLQRKMIPAYAFAAILAVLAYFWAIPAYGASGAAWTTAGVELFILLISFFVVRHQAPVHIYARNLTKYVFSSVIMYLVLKQGLGVIHIAILIPLGMLVYFAAFYGLNLVNPPFQKSD